MLIYNAVNCLGSDYFTRSTKLIYSVQADRLLIFISKLLANMTSALYLALIHVLLRLIFKEGGTEAAELLAIPAVYLIFSLTVSAFSIVLSLIVGNRGFVLVADYFLFFWTVGDNLAALGQKMSTDILRGFFMHNAFYELVHAFASMRTDSMMLKSVGVFTVFFTVLGAVMLRRRDIK